MGIMIAPHQGNKLATGPMGRLGVIFATGLGVGYFPKMPGTIGTLWGVLLFYLLRDLSLGPSLVFTLLLFGFSWIMIYFAEQRFMSHDSSKIVLDEVVGYWVSVFALPFSWPVAALSFVFFRLFDIWKPWPILQVDRRVPGAFGVILDDLVAGVYALICLRILLLFWSP